MSEICFKIIGGKWKGYRWNKIGCILIMAEAGWWICQGLLHYAAYVWKSPQIKSLGTFLVVQWLSLCGASQVTQWQRICPPMQGDAGDAVLIPRSGIPPEGGNEKEKWKWSWWPYKFVFFLDLSGITCKSITVVLAAAKPNSILSKLQLFPWSFLESTLYIHDLLDMDKW